MHAVCVTSARIIGVTNGSTVYEDTVISCAADVNAYPPAQYRWRNAVDGSQSAGSRFTLKPGTQYKLTCTASNNFNRRACYATDYVEFNSKLLFLLIEPMIL